MLVMLGDKTPEKVLRIGTFKWHTLEETVEIHMSSSGAAATFDARAAFVGRVDEEALRSAAARDCSSERAEDPWVRNPWPGIWTSGDQSVGEAEPWPREDIKTWDVYSRSRGNGSPGGSHLGVVIASYDGDALRIEDLRGVIIPYYNASAANLNNFILDSEDFAEEVVGDMRQGIRDNWACRTFPSLFASELGSDLSHRIRERRIGTEEQWLDELEQEETVEIPNKKIGDLWSIPLNVERRKLWLRDWRRHLPKYRWLLKEVKDWSQSREIRHLLRDVLQYYCCTRRNVSKTKKRSGQRCAGLYALCRQKISILVSWSTSGKTSRNQRG